MKICFVKMKIISMWAHHIMKHFTICISSHVNRSWANDIHRTTWSGTVKNGRCIPRGNEDISAEEHWQIFYQIIFFWNMYWSLFMVGPEWTKNIALYCVLLKKIEVFIFLYVSDYLKLLCLYAFQTIPYRLARKWTTLNWFVTLNTSKHSCFWP